MLKSRKMKAKKTVKLCK